METKTKDLKSSFQRNRKAMSSGEELVSASFQQQLQQQPSTQYLSESPRGAGPVTMGSNYGGSAAFGMPTTSVLYSQLL